MDHLTKARWIWCSDAPDCDEYGEFLDSFTFSGAPVTLEISVDSNYEAYVNGHLAAFGQYADFPHDKIFDRVDLTPFCQSGSNVLAIRVWYYGLDSSSVYYPGKAGLLYAVSSGDDLLCQSGESTRARMSRAYRNHRKKIITSQMGYGYGYDATLEDGWLTGQADGFGPAAIVDQILPLRERPNNKLHLREVVKGQLIKRLSPTDLLFDLGREQVGFLRFALTSPVEQELEISYGEHIADGQVRRIIGGRDFMIAYRAKAGKNEFANNFRRFGCRYLQIHSEQPVSVGFIGIAPTMYEVTSQPRPTLSVKQGLIYDMCEETLRLCMHEHYEDCPWREQALYAMDSRNQMLCGYYAFKEFRFARASLELISKDRREDGLLSICYPVLQDFAIPSFSLHYITECREYLDYSGDEAFLRTIYPKLQNIIAAFAGNKRDGLVMNFSGRKKNVVNFDPTVPWGKRYWNFYEWREGLDGKGLDHETPDLVLNGLYVCAIKHMSAIADKLGISNSFAAEISEMNERIRQAYYDPATGVFYDQVERATYSQLGNALAILCGAAEDGEALCERLVSDPAMTPISLSMCCFKYDALLAVDRAKYGPWILADIDKTYTPMIDAGSTTVWETEVGQSDFADAGSLCHGWSALPIYYYHLLLG